MVGDESRLIRGLSRLSFSLMLVEDVRHFKVDLILNQLFNFLLEKFVFRKLFQFLPIRRSALNLDLFRVGRFFSQQIIRRVVSITSDGVDLLECHHLLILRDH